MVDDCHPGAETSRQPVVNQFSDIRSLYRLDFEQSRESENRLEARFE